jgi:hypothetical protein
MPPGWSGDYAAAAAQTRAALPAQRDDFSVEHHLPACQQVAEFGELGVETGDVVAVTR